MNLGTSIGVDTSAVGSSCGELRADAFTVACARVCSGLGCGLPACAAWLTSVICGSADMHGEMTVVEERIVPLTESLSRNSMVREEQGMANIRCYARAYNGQRSAPCGSGVQGRQLRISRAQVGMCSCRSSMFLASRALNVPASNDARHQ